MDPNLFSYYSRELLYLRESGVEFADAHKEEAAGLGIGAGGGEDPFVERLLQGVAFLTSRIRRKLDDQFPEITDAFLSVVFPHCVRPIPPLAVAQIQTPPDPASMASGLTVPRGTPMDAVDSVDGVACKFRSCYAVDLWPVSVASVRMAIDAIGEESQTPGTRATLRLGLECGAQAGWASLSEMTRLRFFLGGEAPNPTALYELLFARLRGVRLVGRDASGGTLSRDLGVGSVHAVGFDDDESAWPFPDHAFPAYQRLQEFFAFREKFLFFDVSLDRPTRQGLPSRRVLAEAGFVGNVELVFDFNAPPRSSLELRSRDFRLFATPVVNLFSHPMEPLRIDRRISEYAVECDRARRHAYALVSIERVSSAPGFLEVPRTYTPFYEFTPAKEGEATEAVHWLLSRKRSPKRQDEGFVPFLSFADPSFRPTSPSAETLTIEGLCCNRDLPSSLRISGDRGVLKVEHPSASVARLLTTPTRMLEPPRGDVSRWRSTDQEPVRVDRRRTSVAAPSAQWELISSLSLNHLSLTSGPRALESLRALLMAHDFAATGSTRQMIAGIVGLSSREVAARAHNRLGNAVSLGRRVELTFDEKEFSGDGTVAFLLATVLEDFLAAYVSINSFSQTVALSKQTPGEIWKAWPPRCGDRTLS